MLDDDLFTVAAFLDPNHKLKWCKKDQVKSNAVKCAVRKLMEKADVVKPAMKNSKTLEPVPKKAAALYDYSDEEPDQEDGNLGVNVKSIETGLQLYLDCNRAGDLLRYWEQQKAVFPRLYAIIRKVFCVPATTAGVERLLKYCWFSSWLQKIAPIRCKL